MSGVIDVKWPSDSTLGVVPRQNIRRPPYHLEPRRRNPYLRNPAPGLTPVLAHVLNLMFVRHSSRTSQDYTPVHKKGKITRIGNYSPIAILPFFVKIWASFSYFVSKFNLLTLSQYGFRRHSSTECVIWESANETDSGQVSAAIFIDLSEAFDTTDHNILLSKRNGYDVWDRLRR